MKKFYSAILAAALSTFGLSAQQTVINPTIFMEIPDDFTVVNLDGMGCPSTDFTPENKPQDTWYVAEAPANLDTGGVYSFMSNSHRNFADQQTSNLLITPQLHVEPGAVLSWKARSINYDLREDYVVLVSTTGKQPADFTAPLAMVQEEGYFWTSHCVDLSAYEGQDIYICFLHCSTHKFLLAVSDLFAGVPTISNLSAKNVGLHFFSKDDEECAIDLHLLNSGATTTITNLEFCSNNNEIIVTHDYDVEIKTGEALNLQFPVDLDIDQSYVYALYANTSDGQSVELLTDVIARNYFKKNLFIEKFTGKWCNSCPGVNPVTLYLLETLGDESSYVEVHHDGGQGYDEMGLPSYFAVASEAYYKVAGDYPALWFNRTYKYDYFQGASLKSYYSAIEESSDAEISDIKANYDQNGNIVVKVKARFKDNLDNSAGNYKIGIAIVDGKRVNANVAGVKKQLNRFPNLGTFYGIAHYLNAAINPGLIAYHNVAVYGTYAWYGRPNSIPSTLNAGEEYEYTYTVPALNNDYIQDPENLSAVVSLVNSDIMPYVVMNAAHAHVDNYSAGIGELQSDSRPANTDVYNMQGVMIHKAATPEQISALVPGLYIIGGKKVLITK